MTSEFESAWYGTYKVSLDEPEPTENSTYWPPKIYVCDFLWQIVSPSLQLAKSHCRQRMTRIGGNLLGELAMIINALS